MKPQYTHDCDACKFLGFVTTGFVTTDEKYDVYFCKKSAFTFGDGTLICRFGNEGFKYSSFPLSIIRDNFESLQDTSPLKLAYMKFRKEIEAIILG
jgi:hypothetical protein